MYCASLQTSDPESQTDVAISTACSHDHRGTQYCANSSFCIAPTTCPLRRFTRKVADQTSESAGKPEEAPTAGRSTCRRDISCLQCWPPLSFQNPQPRSRSVGTHYRTRAEQGVGQATASQLARQPEVGGSRGPVPRDQSRRMLQGLGASATEVLRVRSAREPAEKAC